jgi:iron(III) transport system permease protein
VTSFQAGRLAQRDTIQERWVSGAALAALLAVIGIPIGYLLYGAFCSDSPGTPNSTFTLKNWTQVYGTTLYGRSFLNTLILSATVSVITVAVGATLAWIVARTNAPWREKLAPLLVVPLMISTLVTTLAWIALAAPNAGFINAMIEALFGVKKYLNIYSFAGIVYILVLHYSAFAFIVIYAALRSIDSSLEEASYMLGATPLRTLFSMTLPLIWPSLASTFFLVFVFVAENFAVPTMLGATFGYSTLIYEIYQAMTVEPSRPPVAAAAGTMLLSIAVIGTWWQRRIIARASHYVTIGGKGGKQRLTDLGRWKSIATAILALYLLLSVVIPYFALVVGSLMKFVTPKLKVSLFTTGNYTSMIDSAYLEPLLNSLILAGLGALGATLAYVFVAYVIKRSHGLIGRVADYAVMIPTVTPALVLGIGFVWAYLSLPIPIYGTIWILILAYFTRFLGQGVRQSRAAFVQVSEELSEAARIAGASASRTFWQIVLPVLRPSVVSLWTVMFILFFMELSITIVLYSPSTITLPVLLWLRMSNGFLTQAFALAVVEATVIFVVLFFADRFFGTLRSTLYGQSGAA